MTRNVAVVCSPVRDFMACTGYTRAMEKHYRPHRLKHVLNYKAEHTTLSVCLSVSLSLSLDVTWRATCRADIEIAGNCLISYTLQNAGCWTTSSCGDSSECPARRQQRFQLEGRRRGGQHRYRIATQTPRPLFISKHGGFAQHPRPVLQKETP